MADNQRGHNFGFRISYDATDHTGVTTVTVTTGLSGRTDLDLQYVQLDDATLPFRVDADVLEGEVRRLEFESRPGHAGLEQKHLRTSGLVSLVRQWAAVARGYQFGDRGPDEEEFLLELPRKPDVQEALRATHKALTAWAPAIERRRRRVTGDASEDLLMRVVRRYRELTNAGHRSPRQVIAKEESYTPEHIGRLLVKARRRGLLAPASPGRAGEARASDETSAEEIEF